MTAQPRTATAWALALGLLGASGAAAQDTQTDLNVFLNLLLSMEVGMPLDEAVEALEAQGFEPLFEPASLDAIAGLSVSEDPEGAWSIVTENGPTPGTALSRATLRSASATQETVLTVTTHMSRGWSLVQIMSGLPSGDGGAASNGVYLLGGQFFLDAEDAVDPAAVEAQVREAVGAPPTCESAGRQTELLWLYEQDDSVVPLMAPEDCLRTMQSVGRALDPATVVNEVMEGRQPTGSMFKATVFGIRQSRDQTIINLHLMDADLAVEIVTGAVHSAMSGD